MPGPPLPPPPAGPSRRDPERLARALLGEALPDRDRDAAAAGLAALAPALSARDAWAFALEPAIGFDPLAAGGGAAPAWPEAHAEPAASAAPPAGTLEADLATAAGPGGAQRVADAYRVRIAAHNPALNAYIHICAPQDPQSQPNPGPLSGAAIAVKDIIETAGLPTTGGSSLRADYIPATDATCWARLAAAGALCLGKTNTHEFAAGTTNENTHFGPVHNPFAPGAVAGGSSGGSACAVAAGLCSAALGTDTGGSVRIPAACCGVVGFKPTYGRVPRRGVFALAWSLDHVGPVARTVRDAALVFAAMAGASADEPGPAGLPDLPGAAQIGRPRPGALAGLRIGIPRAWLAEAGPTATATGGVGVDPAVRAGLERAVAACQALGARVVEIDLGSADLATAVNRVIALPESAAYHAPHLHGDSSGYGPQVRGRLLAGRLVTAEDYLQAQRHRALLCRQYAAALAGPAGVQLVLTPALPIPAPALGAPAALGLSLLRFAAPFNVVGWPAIVLPSGTDASGLPTGVQLAAGPGRDAELLAAAATLEAALGPGPVPALGPAAR